MTATLLHVFFIFYLFFIFLCGSFFIQFQCVFASNLYIRVSMYLCIYMHMRSNRQCIYVSLQCNFFKTDVVVSHFFFFFLFSAQNTAHRGSSSPAQQQAVFLKAVNDWVNVPDSLCRSLVSDHTSELVHESDDGVRLCEGVRVHSRRRFLGDAPPLVFFNVRTFFENGSIESWEGIPCSITLVDIQYHLVAATFFFLVLITRHQFSSMVLAGLCMMVLVMSKTCLIL